MKITIAIPTIAGRGQYLASCLQTCLTQDSGDFEILVSDNSLGEAEDLCRSLNDQRIRYVRPSKYLSMSDHWEFVLQQARGDSITFIGDDDGLMPGCIHRLQLMFGELGNVPIHHSLANYYWPDFPTKILRNHVQFFHPISLKQGWRQSDQFLRDAAKGQARYVDGPMIYHNFMPLGLIQSLKRNEIFFRRSSPDIYSAIAIAANTERFYSTEMLLTISGQGARANGASVKRDGEDGSKFLKEAETSAIHAPRFKSRTIQMHYLDAMLEVAKTYSDERLSGQICLERHLSIAIGEAGRFPSIGLKTAEWIRILAVAAEYNATAGIVRQLSHDLWKRFNAASRRPSERSGRIPPSIELEKSVLNIYSASLALDNILYPHAQHEK